MNKSTIVTAIVITTLCVVACGPRIMVPPRIDLTRHEIVGIIEFECEDPDLGEYITEEFIQLARKDQGTARIIELGTRKELLRSLDRGYLDESVYEELREFHNINTIIIGKVDISSYSPDVDISDFNPFDPLGSKIRVKAYLEGEMSAKLIETATGASLWSHSAEASEYAGEVGISGPSFEFDRKNPDKVYDRVIGKLLHEMTRDFRVTYR